MERYTMSKRYSNKMIKNSKWQYNGNGKMLQ